MECKVEGCKYNSMYKAKRLCQKHYFRFMRNGHYGLFYEVKNGPSKRMYRTQNPAGYQKLREPQHFLSDSSGYVYEHRFVYFNEVSENPSICNICCCKISWSTCHIDHIDKDVSNNHQSNLRATCFKCNLDRGRNAESNGKVFFEADGRKMTAGAWSRQEGVKVCGTTILMRKRKLGMNDYDCIYSERITHKSTKSKAGKKPLEHDLTRGIASH